MYFRSYDEVLAMFDGFELVAPGVVNAPEWRREPGCDDTGPQDVYVGLVAKPDYGAGRTRSPVRAMLTRSSCRVGQHRLDLVSAM